MNIASPFRPAARALAALLVAAVAAGAQAAPVHLRLIGFNDFHGNLEPSTLSLTLADPADGKPLRVAVGGAPALAGLVQSLRAGADHSLLLSGGDLVGAAPLASTLFRHESTVDVMNAMGLELSVAGNHEFDAGLPELQRLARGGCAGQGGPAVSCPKGPYTGARFPFVASNVLDSRGRAVLAPYVIKRYGGVKLAVIGAVTKTTPSMVMPSGIEGLRFVDEADAVNRTARKLRAMGVRNMIAVVHEGGEIGMPQQRGDWNDTRCSGAQGAIFSIARRLVPEIRVVYSAHTHQGYRCEIGGRLVIQGTSYGRGVSVVDIDLDPTTGKPLGIAASANLPVFNEQTDAAVRERLTAAMPEAYASAVRAARSDPDITRRVAEYAELAAPIAQRKIGSIAATFHRSGSADSEAGRLIADVQLAATRDGTRGGAQMAFTNPGGIRSDLECRADPPCVVTFGQAFTMQPFGNSLVVMTLSGERVRALLESQQRRPGAEPTLLQPSEGLSYTWQANAPEGHHVHELRLQGEPVRPESKYRVTVNSFLAEGGDGFTILREGTDRTGGMLDVDALVDYLTSGGTLTPTSSSRILRID